MARKSKFVDEVDDLNLIPVMNMIMCIIPVILVSSSMVKIGVVNVNAPKFGMGSSADSTVDEKPLNLTVAIGEDGFRITASGADIYQLLGVTPDVAADPSAPSKPMIPKVDGKYNYQELYNKLMVVKKAYPDESIMNLTADSRVQFKYVIGVMDVVRVKLEQESYTDAVAFQKASTKMDGAKPELLWPDVVFAVAQ